MPSFDGKFAESCASLRSSPLSVDGRRPQHNTAWWVGGWLVPKRTKIRRRRCFECPGNRCNRPFVRLSVRVRVCVCVRPSPLQRDTGAAAAVEASQTGLCPSPSNSLILSRLFKKSRKRKKKKNRNSDDCNQNTDKQRAYNNSEGKKKETRKLLRRRKEN